MTLPSEAPGMFGYLVTRLAAHPENVATDALHYVVPASTCVKDTLTSGHVKLSLTRGD